MSLLKKMLRRYLLGFLFNSMMPRKSVFDYFLFFQLSAVGVKALSTFVNCPSEKSDIEYKDGQIVSASLETLVDMLRPGANKSYVFTFILCSRLFVKPHELLGKLCKRYFKTYDKIVSILYSCKIW